MSRREFQFSDGSSNKFWAIEVDGTSQTVHFGRVGTAGQAQSKVFASEDEAKKASDKLIAEKVKKDYKELTTGTKSAGTPTAKVKAAGEPAAEKPKAKAAKATEPEPPGPATPPSIPVSAGVTRSIDLQPEDIQKAEWPRKWRQQSRPVPRPFDVKQCVEELSGVTVNQYHYWDYSWPQKLIPKSMTGKEAHFWLLAIVESSKRDDKKPESLARRIAKADFKEKLSVQEVMDIVKEADRNDSIIALPLSALQTPREFVSLILSDLTNKYGDSYILHQLVDGFAQFVMPYLSEKELREIQDEIRPKVQPDVWAPDLSHLPPVCFLAAHLGLHSEVQKGLANMSEPGPDIGGGYYGLRFLIL